jgi:N-acetylneuraminic acid mutarotase
MRRRSLLAYLLLTTLLQKGAVASPWQEIAPPPIASAGFARAQFPEGPVFSGGNRWDGGVKRTLDEVWLYRPDQNRWEAFGRLPRTFAFGAFGLHNDVLILLGGDDGSTTRNDGVVLRKDGQATPFPSAITSFAYAGSAFLKGHLHIVGGVDDATAPLKMHGNFRSIDLDTGYVTMLPAYGGGPVIHPAVVTLSGILYAFTGGQAAGNPSRLVNVDSAFRYDPELLSWFALPPYPFPVRGLSACVLDERHILLAGGYRDAAAAGAGAAVTDEACIFDTATRTYRTVGPLPYAGMLVGLVVHDGWLYLFGGETGPRQRASRAYRIRVAALLEPQ